MRSNEWLVASVNFSQTTITFTEGKRSRIPTIRELVVGAHGVRIHQIDVRSRQGVGVEVGRELVFELLHKHAEAGAREDTLKFRQNEAGEETADRLLRSDSSGLLPQ